MTDERFGCAAYGLVIKLIDHLEDTKVLTPTDAERIFGEAAEMLAVQAKTLRSSEMLESAKGLQRMIAERNSGKIG